LHGSHPQPRLLRDCGRRTGREWLENLRGVVEAVLLDVEIGELQPPRIVVRQRFAAYADLTSPSAPYARARW
jgi:hypothetical protein